MACGGLVIMARKPIYAPWKKGPATIVHFPDPPMRAIVIERTTGTNWIGRMIDEHGDQLFRTEPGKFDLVMECVTQHRVRCGLPIVVLEGVGRG